MCLYVINTVWDLKPFNDRVHVCEGSVVIFPWWGGSGVGGGEETAAENSEWSSGADLIIQLGLKHYNLYIDC